MEISDAEIQHLKEQNNRRVKRVVTAVALTLIIFSLILVAMSLSFGRKMDQLVSESMEGKLDADDLFNATRQRVKDVSKSYSNQSTASG